MELDDRKLKDREEKLRERQKNYFMSQLSCLKMIWISLKNKKIRPFKKCWYDWLIKQTMVGGKKQK